MKKHSSYTEKLLKKSRAKAYQKYYLWLVSSPEVRASMQISPLKFKIK